MASPRTTPRLGRFDTLEQLDVLAAPFRIHLLECFRRPTTVKQVAARLGIPVTRLYYHVNLLLDHGFLSVAEERRVGGMMERLFEVTADSFHPSPGFVERYGGEGRLEAAKLVLRTAEAGFEAAAAHGLFDDLADNTATVSLSQIRLSPERRADFLGRLEELLNDYDDEDGEPMWRVVAFVPRWTGPAG